MEGSTKWRDAGRRGRRSPSSLRPAALTSAGCLAARRRQLAAAGCLLPAVQNLNRTPNSDWNWLLGTICVAFPKFGSGCVPWP